MADRKKARRNPHTGSTFQSWLEEEGIADEVDGAAVKAVLSYQLWQSSSLRPLRLRPGSSPKSLPRLRKVKLPVDTDPDRMYKFFHTR